MAIPTKLDGELVEIEQRAAGIIVQLGILRRVGVRSTPNGDRKVERGNFETARLLSGLGQAVQDYVDAVLACAHGTD
jgi:hypothetical protein